MLHVQVAHGHPEFGANMINVVLSPGNIESLSSPYPRKFGESYQCFLSLDADLDMVIEGHYCIVAKLQVIWHSATEKLNLSSLITSYISHQLQDSNCIIIQIFICSRKLHIEEGTLDAHETSVYIRRFFHAPRAATPNYRPRGY